MKRYAIIVAGGTGSRMQSATPKQFLELEGKPILLHTLEKFYAFDSSMELIVVLPEEYINKWNGLREKHNVQIPHSIVVGGKTRYHSVENGLQKIEEEGIVAVHDAVRCLVSQKVLERCFTEAEEKGNAVPVVAVKDSLRKGSFDNSEAIDRKEYYAVQTPQVFTASMLKNAYALPYKEEFTDDASVVEQAGNTIFLCEGDEQNIKITTPEDLHWATIILKNS